MGGQGDVSFADTLKGALGEVQELQTEAKDAIGAFLRGDPVEIHEVMAATEEAGIALDMLIEIRNKLADAYRSVIQMQG
jgi:flagellar hook-basal body complex protein FliE